MNVGTRFGNTRCEIVDAQTGRLLISGFQSKADIFTPKKRSDSVEGQGGEGNGREEGNKGTRVDEALRQAGRDSVPSEREAKL